MFWGLLYLILRTQGIHPFNPGGFDSAPWDVAFNTTSSFVTNTNWQFYGGETTMSNFSQMAGLAVQNFVSAAVGISVAIAFIRGVAARSGTALGNYYVDLWRTLVFVLLPISVVFGLFLVLQGVPQSIDLPVASQEVIKQLGTNGGGFFNVNSAHPFENPTWLSNFVEMLLILAIPAGLTATYGRMVGNRRQGWVDLRRDARRSSSSPSSWSTSPRRDRPRRWTPRASPASTWRARSSASAPPPPRSGSSSRPPPRAAPSTAPWRRSPASAASSRWRRCRPAR